MPRFRRSTAPSLRVFQLLLVLPLIFLLSTAASAAVENYTVSLNGDQVVPDPIVTAATGSGTLHYDTATKMLSFEISIQDLSSPEVAAHIHGPAKPGAQATVIFALPLGSPKVGSVGPLTASQETDLSKGLWYINVHTENYLAGEIRGQIMPSSVPAQESSWGRVKAAMLSFSPTSSRPATRNR